MFWNDPSLYGATLPYKEFGMFPHREFGTVPTQFMPTTFNPWQNIPRFTPPVYGTLPFFDVRFCDPRMFVQPWLQTPQVNPYVQPYNTPFMQTPQINPFMQTQFGQIPQINPFMQTPFAHVPQFNPLVQPFNLNLPLHNPYRPFL